MLSLDLLVQLALQMTSFVKMEGVSITTRRVTIPTIVVMEVMKRAAVRSLFK